MADSRDRRDGDEGSRLKTGRVIIVEGKYDRVRLVPVVDALIAETGGFAIFTDDARMDMIRRMAEKNGAVILTDSDRAGFLIRTYLGNKLRGCDVRHAYIPDVMGKERRKTAPSKEGKLGVEGQATAALREALERAAGDEWPEARDTENARGERRVVTTADLYDDGLLGGLNSAELRRDLLARMGLPARLSVRRLLDVLNSLMDYAEYKSLLKQP